MTVKTHPAPNAAVAEVFEQYPAAVRHALLQLRSLILEVAAATPGVGRLEESLKWGQASFLTPETKSGSTIRIDRVKNRDDQVAVYFHCQSQLIPMIRERYGDQFSYDGKRALVFETGEPLPEAELKHAIAMALTYHLKGK